MSVKLSDILAARCFLLVRCFFVVFAGIGVWWGISGFSVFWHESATERIASRIIAGDVFKADILARQRPIIDSIETAAYCRPAALRSAAIIQLRVVEIATAAKDGTSADETNKLDKMVHNALSCAPADSFFWLVLYWAEGAENDVSPEYLKYLRMSYRLGPNEGWVGLKRSSIATGLFDDLPDDLKDAALKEFSGLVKMSFVDAGAILTGPGWPIRDILLSRLTTVDERDRKSFAKNLHDRGYDVSVPGIELSVPEWQRGPVSLGK